MIQCQTRGLNPPQKNSSCLNLSLNIFFFSHTIPPREKEMKRNTLLELVEYLNSGGREKVITEAVIGDICTMVATNLFRSLPPQVASTSLNLSFLK